MLEKNNNNTNTSPSTRKHLSFYNYNNTCGAKIINVLNIWTRKEKINFKQKGEPFSHPERQRKHKEGGEWRRRSKFKLL